MMNEPMDDWDVQDPMAEAVGPLVDQLKQMMQQMEQMHQQQAQMFQMLMHAMTAPKRVVKDQRGQVVGVETVAQH